MDRVAPWLDGEKQLSIHVESFACEEGLSKLFRFGDGSCLPARLIPGAALRDSDYAVGAGAELLRTVFRETGKSGYDINF